MTTKTPENDLDEMGKREEWWLLLLFIVMILPVVIYSWIKEKITNKAKN